MPLCHANVLVAATMWALSIVAVKLGTLYACSIAPALAQTNRLRPSEVVVPKTPDREHLNKVFRFSEVGSNHKTKDTLITAYGG